MKRSAQHLSALNQRTQALAKQWLRESEALLSSDPKSIDHYAITTAALHHALQLILDRADDAARESLGE